MGAAVPRVEAAGAEALGALPPSAVPRVEAALAEALGALPPSARPLKNSAIKKGPRLALGPRKLPKASRKREGGATGTSGCTAALPWAPSCMAAAGALPNAPTSACCAPPSAAGAFGACARKPEIPVSAPGAAAATRGGGALAPSPGRPKRERRLAPGESGAQRAMERGETEPRSGAADDAEERQGSFTRFAGRGRGDEDGDCGMRSSAAGEGEPRSGGGARGEVGATREGAAAAEK